MSNGETVTAGPEPAGEDDAKAGAVAAGGARAGAVAAGAAGAVAAGAVAAGAGPAGPAARLGGQSRWADIGGRVHYLDFGGPAGAPVIVCVHGLEGAAVNWVALAPLLTGRYRVLAPDLAGHGLTRAAGRSTSVQANQALLHGFIQAVAGGPVILMGNSMGGMISLLEASAAPELVTALVLVDPALPFVPARPDPVVVGLFGASALPGVKSLVTGYRRRWAPEVLVSRLLWLCCADSSRVSEPVVAAHVETARLRSSFADADRDLSAAVRSILITASYVTGRHYRQAVRTVSCPVLLLHGAADRLVPVAAARAAARSCPAWTLEVLPGIGHVPQLEAPDDCARIIGGWLGAKVPLGREGRR
jgi:pimeloyl-ACP methyl ester carboxylesterase